MNDTGTRALERIADALELQALVTARDSYWATLHCLLDDYDAITPDQINEPARRIDNVDSRIDQLTGYQEEDE